MDDLDSVPSEGSHFEIPVGLFRPKKKAQKLDSRVKLVSQEECKTAMHIKKEKNSKDVEMIAHTLSKNYIFKNQSTENRVAVISHMSLLKLSQDEIVFEQGSVGHSFYIVVHGKLNVFRNDELINTLSSGDCFGELALLHNALRSATIKTISRVYLWKLDQNSFKQALHSVNIDKTQEYKEFILTVPIFQNLTKSQINLLAHSMSLFTISKNKLIVKEGEPGNALYIIKEGLVKVLNQGILQTELKKGNFFGERALLYNCPYHTTIIALSEVVCLVLSKKSIISSLGSELQSVIYENSKRNCIKNSKILSKLDFHAQQSLSSKIKISIFNNGELVVPQNTSKSSKLFFVIQGTLISPSQIVGNIYDILGDLDETNDTNDAWTENILAQGECHIGEITKGELKRVIGMKLKYLSKYAESFKAFRIIPLFNSLTNEKIFEIVSKAQLLSFVDKSVIIEQGSAGSDFFVIKSGKVQIIQTGKLVRVENKTDYFGERSLLFDEIRTATVVADEEVTCWVLNKADFCAILTNEIRNRMTQRILFQDISVKLKNLSVIKLIGVGTFGQVYLVYDIKSSQYFALKIVPRKLVQQYRINENLLLEKNILKSIDHPLALKLVSTFKDPQRVYFLTEYVKGLDLFEVLRNLNGLNELSAKFYTVCLILLLEYLHDKEIIYRDLKPENVRIDIEGYPKLVDFGTCKYLRGKTYTIIGTPFYMPPEMILGHGYTFTADLWSLGVVLFELVYGKLPFAQGESDPAKIYEEVLTKKVEFEVNQVVSAEFIQLAQVLLRKKPNKRFGGSFENVKQAEWVKNIRWEMYVNKSIQAPYIPKLYDEEVSHKKENFQSLSQVLENDAEFDSNPNWFSDF